MKVAKLQRTGIALEPSRIPNTAKPKVCAGPRVKTLAYRGLIALVRMRNSTALTQPFPEIRRAGWTQGSSVPDFFTGWRAVEELLCSGQPRSVGQSLIVEARTTTL